MAYILATICFLLFSLSLSSIVNGQSPPFERQQKVLERPVPPELNGPWENYCPVADNKTLSFDNGNFILHCENSIFFESTPNANGIRECAQSCKTGSCLGAYMEKDGYCIKAVRSPEENVAVLVPAEATTITVPTTVVSTSVSTQISTTTMTSTSTSILTSLLTKTSTSTVTTAQVETRTFFLNPTGGTVVPAPGNYAPVYSACGGATEIWTVQGKQYAFYPECTEWKDYDKYYFTNSRTVGGCVEDFAKATKEYTWAYIIRSYDNSTITGCTMASNRTYKPEKLKKFDAIFPL